MKAFRKTKKRNMICLQFSFFSFFFVPGHLQYSSKAMYCGHATITNKLKNIGIWGYPEPLKNHPASGREAARRPKCINTYFASVQSPNYIVFQRHVFKFDDILSTSISTSISATKSYEKFDQTRGLMRRIFKERKFNMNVKGVCFQSAKIKRRTIFFQKNIGAPAVYF